MDLRKDFFIYLDKLASTDDSVMLLVGDLGHSFMEEFAAKHPKQFINCGIAEQNMVGVAAGLALGGKKPYVYSGTIFLLMRAYEQIRDDVCFNNTNVKLIGTGASQFLGFTHNLLNGENEESLLQYLPNLERHYPQSAEELDTVMTQTYQSDKPAFIRI